MRILITAGPTREMIDDVRFISNLASGQLGILIAELASEVDEVILVLGPTNLSTAHLKRVEIINIVSATEMYNEVEKRFSDCDAFISTAAVADYRPKDKIIGKYKKRSDNWNIELIRNPDILLHMGKCKQKQISIGFALEPDNIDSREEALINANKKLLEKNCDMIVLNSPKNLGEKTEDSIYFITENGIESKFESINKQTQASEILKFLRNLRN